MYIHIYIYIYIVNSNHNDTCVHICVDSGCIVQVPFAPKSVMMSLVGLGFLLYV